MDPYDDDILIRAQTNATLHGTDGARDAQPAIQRLKEMWNAMKQHAPALGNKHDDHEPLRDLRRSKSSSVAQYAREHPRLPRFVKVGLGAIGLGGLLALLLKKRPWRRP